MDEKIKKIALKNMIFVFLAQIISVLLSCTMSLIIPKILGVNDFSYWQLFLFYINYVGFFHFGITDGMYLKTGGKELASLDKRELHSEFLVLFFLLLLIFIPFFMLALIFIKNDIRIYILIFTGIYMIIANLNWFLGYVFQATNRVKLYSISVMIDKLLFLVFILFAFFTKFNILKLYIPIYVLTTTIALIFSLYNSKEIITTKPYNIKKSLKLSFDSAKIGIKITLSSISSLLILGVGRFLVDKVWGIESFGKFSFALSLTNFFLLFIAQVSIVLFPTLRKVSINTAKKLYEKFNDSLNCLLPFIYVLYIPMKIILSLWLPQYKISLDYLALLLPICIFDGKMQMISNTYFKVIREESNLLKVNILTVIISTLCSLFGIFVTKNLYTVIIGMVVSIAFRSILAEYILSKKLNVKMQKNTIYELLISILFILFNLEFNNTCSFLLIVTIYILYLLVTRLYSEIFDIIKNIKGKIVH